jgi:hypothetical protein
LKEPQLAMTFLGIILFCQSFDLPWDDVEKVVILGGDLAKSNYMPDIKYKSYIYPSIFLHSKNIYM